MSSADINSGVNKYCSFKTETVLMTLNSLNLNVHCA